MIKKIVTACLLALLIPYIVTLAWTGSVENNKKEIQAVSGKRILLDRGGNGGYIDVEEYLPGVVAGQIPADYGTEALRAQAIIARTYIYKRMGDESEIAESALGLNHLQERQLEELWGSSHFVDYYEQVEDAVRSTACMALTYDGVYIDPLFTRASAGITRAGDEKHPYLQPVDCPGDVEAENYLSIFTWSKDEFAEKVNSIPDAAAVTAEQIPSTIQMISKEEGGYVTKIQIGTKSYTGEEIQTALGLSSVSFSLEEYEGGMRAVCKGIGHGYGLSQYGAKQKAEEGWTAEDILSYFYKNIVLISE